jgi:glycerol-3-phosphate dehydrogenase subunit B
MPRADVVVIGAGLAGLTAALRLAEAGASVTLVAKGHTSTHWASGGIDVAAPSGAATVADGVAALARDAAHPYAFLEPDVGPAVAWLTTRLAGAGLQYTGSLDAPVRPVPTAIGATRRVGIVPAAQAAATRPWDPDEVLVVAGPAGFKDFWPAAVGGSLARESVWPGSDRPREVHPVVVELPGFQERNNRNALELARRFDEPATRAQDVARIARAAVAVARGRPGRVALPAVIGLHAHAEAWSELGRQLPLEPFEVPLVPPSIPGMRLWNALRSLIRAAGGRIQVGELVERIVVEDGRVVAVDMEAATRGLRIRTDAVILATGGIAGGGLVGTPDGRLVEPLLALPVEAPPVEDWLRRDALDPAGHPLEAAGIRTDATLHPVGGGASAPLPSNVLVAGALLAGQRAIRERCGDGVAIASGWRAANELAGVAGRAEGILAGTGAAAGRSTG